MTQTSIASMTIAVLLGLMTGPATADLLSSTSPTIRNNLCVGGSCFTDETFSSDFHQLTLNNPNTRIEFRDASSLAGTFPYVDWALQANERTTGSQNQFMLQNLDAGTTPLTVHAGAGNNALFIADGGNVGIGTGIPETDLHIFGGTTASIRLQSFGVAPQSWQVLGTDSVFAITDWTNGGSQFGIETGGPAASIYVDDAGFVGLGTSSPEEKLHIRTTADNADAFALFDAQGAGSDSAFRLRQNGVTPSTWEFRNQQDSGRLNVGLAGGNTPFKIDNRANNNLLRLGRNGLPGEVNITGTLVVNNTALNVPDYVFADDYALRPLAEVQAFIDTNSHLPDVPSEAEIKANGVDMTAMQMTLLKKVEELTLYTLKQEARLAEVDALRAELAEVKTLLAAPRP